MSSTNDQVSDLVKKGWRIVSDGQSGVQLEGPKKMKGLDTACLIGGVVVLLLFWPIGLLMIFAALIDYAFMTKAETKFIPRS